MEFLINNIKGGKLKLLIQKQYSMVQVEEKDQQLELDQQKEMEQLQLMVKT